MYNYILSYKIPDKGIKPAIRKVILIIVCGESSLLPSYVSQTVSFRRWTRKLRRPPIRNIAALRAVGGVVVVTQQIAVQSSLLLHVLIKVGPQTATSHQRADITLRSSPGLPPSLPRPKMSRPTTHHTQYCAVDYIFYIRYLYNNYDL